MTSYMDFDVEISRIKDKTYTLAVIKSPAGEAREIIKFPYDDQELQEKLYNLKIALLRSGGRFRKVISSEEQEVQSFGQDLFNLIFTSNIRSLYDVSQRESIENSMGLRLRLRIQAPELASLPWEFLFDTRRGEYLCLSTNTPIIRYFELSQPVRPIAVKLPLRILGLVSNPTDLPPLDINQEKLRFEASINELRRKGLIELVWLENGSWRDLQKIMKSGPWHIFHFIGHGGFDRVSDEGFIAIPDEDAGGRTYKLLATQLARILSDHQSLRIIVLNSCEGARGGEIDIFSSTASILVQRGVPAVIAMQYEITDKAAIEFTRTFYEMIVETLPIDTAVTEARKAISLSINNSIEWGTPVLFMRSTDGLLFSIHKPDEEVDKVQSIHLSDLLIRSMNFRRWTNNGWTSIENISSHLCVPVGMTNLARSRGNNLWHIDLNQKDGHFWVVGSPGSGINSFLRTFLLSLVQSHTPEDIYIYLLDFGNRSLRLFENFPHCGGVFLHDDVERIKRLLVYLQDEVKRRRDLLEQSAVDSPIAYRNLKPKEPFPAIIVVIDNYSEFRRYFEYANEDIASLIRSGKTVDIHFLITTDLPSSLPSQIQGNIANRLALRLGNPSYYSELLFQPIKDLRDRPDIGYIRVDQEVIECRLALPVQGSESTHYNDILAISEEMQNAWKGALPHKIMQFPTVITEEEFITTMTGGLSNSSLLPIGIDFETLEPVFLDFQNHSNCWAISGLPRSGKTNFLIYLANVVSRLYTNSWEIITYPLLGGKLLDYAENHQISIVENVEELVTKLSNEIRPRGERNSSDIKRILVLVDDIGALHGGGFDDDRKLRELVSSIRLSANTVFFAAGDLIDFGYSDFIKLLKNQESGLLFSTDETDLIRFTNIKRPNFEVKHVPGRCFFYNRRNCHLIQTPYSQL